MKFMQKFIVSVKLCSTITFPAARITMSLDTIVCEFLHFGFGFGFFFRFFGLCEDGWPHHTRLTCLENWTKMSLLARVL